MKHEGQCEICLKQEIINDKNLCEDCFKKSDRLTRGAWVWAGAEKQKARKEKPKYIPNPNIDKDITQYHKTGRLSSAIIEEKVDGSNFCFMRKSEDGKLHFYARTQEIDPEDPQTKFYKQFTDYVIEQDKINPLEPDIKYFGEVLGQAQIKYFGGNKEMNSQPISKRMYIFDIKNAEGKFYKREWVEKLCKDHNLTIVPEVTWNDHVSKVDPNVLREGIIMRFEGLDGYDDTVIKIKNIERDFKHGKSTGAELEIKQLKPIVNFKTGEVRKI